MGLLHIKGSFYRLKFKPIFTFFPLFACEDTLLFKIKWDLDPLALLPTMELPSCSNSGPPRAEALKLQPCSSLSTYKSSFHPCATHPVSLSPFHSPSLHSQLLGKVFAIFSPLLLLMFPFQNPLHSASHFLSPVSPVGWIADNLRSIVNVAWSFSFLHLITQSFFPSFLPHSLLFSLSPSPSSSSSSFSFTCDFHTNSFKNVLLLCPLCREDKHDLLKITQLVRDGDRIRRHAIW